METNHLQTNVTTALNEKRKKKKLIFSIEESKLEFLAWELPEM